MAQTSTGLVGIPCAEHGRWSAFWLSTHGLDLPDGWSVKGGQGQSIAKNRNYLITEAIDRGVEWLLFLDDDQEVSAPFLRQLLATDHQAVVGLSFYRSWPFRPLWFRSLSTSSEVSALHYDELPATGCVKLAWATMGGLLIHTDLLREMPRPWCRLGQHGVDVLNEDLDFYARLAAIGGELYGCVDARAGHIMNCTVWPHRDPATGRWQAALARGTEAFVALAPPVREESVCAV